MYVSVEHTVMENKVGTVLLVFYLFSTDSVSSSKLCRPINELLSEGNPQKYHATKLTLT